MHEVNRAYGEMPEGARSTDEENGEEERLADEFRALDIDLDAPLRPDEVVKAPQAYTRVYPSPPKQPLVPRPPTLNEERGTNVANGEIVRKTRKDGGEKRKKKKASLQDGGSSKSNLFHMDTVEVVKKCKKTKKKERREAYEEASGTCTPSIPRVSSVVFDEFVKLAANKDIGLEYLSKASSDALEHGRVSVAIRVRNLGVNKLRKVEINMVDTLNARTIGDKPLLLCDGVEGEGVSEVCLDVQVLSIDVARTLRGTVTYFVDEEDGARGEKIDVRVAIPVTTFLLQSTSIRKEEYSAMLASDEVDFAATTSCVNSSDVGFKAVLANLARKTNFIVVEETPKAASLFSRTINGQPVCLLVKKNPNGLQIDGKAGEQQLIQSIVQDVAEICSKL